MQMTSLKVVEVVCCNWNLRYGADCCAQDHHVEQADWSEGSGEVSGSVVMGSVAVGSVVVGQREAYR